MAHNCTGINSITICKHVETGSKPDVYVGSSEGTEFALCRACADTLDSLNGLSDATINAAMDILVTVLCAGCAAQLGIPPTMPGPLGFYDSTLQLRQPMDEAA